MDSEENGGYDPQNLKILIVSTPKTGNTWVKRLLANVYDLPIVKAGMKFDPAEIENLGPRWITHQHYRARADVIDCGQRNNIVLVTTIRHPCDALVSKFHHVKNFGKHLPYADVDRSLVILQDGDEIGEHTASYVVDGFSTFLAISLGWLRSGKSHIIRYEDLKRDPVGTLQNLTDSICAVARERIEQAVEACDIRRMRKTPRASKHFRQGKVGSWRSELPRQIIEILRSTDPFPAQFAELGYSLDQDYPVSMLPWKPTDRTNVEPVQPTFLDEVHATASVKTHWPIAWPTWPKGIWPKIVALAQKVTRRLLRWYTNPIVEQQNRFNSAVVQALDEIWWEISHLRKQLARLEREISQKDE